MRTQPLRAPIKTVERNPSGKEEGASGLLAVTDDRRGRWGPQQVLIGALNGPAALVCAGVLIATACGPHTVLRQHDPLRTQTLSVTEQRGSQVLRLGDVELPAVDGIGIAGLTWSRDGSHLAYPAGQGGGWRIIRDGQAGPAWDAVGAPVYSADGAHLAYAARRGRTWQVVIDDQAGSGWDGILGGTLRLSPDGRHHAYVAQTGSERVVVHDGRPDRPCQRVAQLSLSDDGGGPYYLAQVGAWAYVRCRAEVYGPFAAAAELVSSPAGSCTYIAKQNQRWRVYVGSHEIGAYDSAAGLTRHPGGQIAYVARLGSQERVIRGSTLDPVFSGIDFRSLSYNLSGDIFGYIARTHRSLNPANSGGLPATSAQVVINGTPGPNYSNIIDFQIASQHYAYVAILPEGRTRVVIDDQPGPMHPFVLDLQLHPTAPRALYVTSIGGRPVISTPSGTYPYPLVLPGSLTWSPDGQHWGCIAGEDPSALYFVLDGERRKPFELDELYQTWLSGQLTAPAAASTLRAWVRAELARAAR